MTRTTEIEYHPDRPFVHFGSPEGTAYWQPKPEEEEPKKMRYVTKFRKKGIR